MAKGKVVEKGVRAVKRSLNTLEKEADKLLGHKHVRTAAQTRSSVDGSLGLADHESDKTEEVGH